MNNSTGETGIGWRKKLIIFFASIAPGIFLIGLNIGTGSITTMASAGAAYGMSLVWALLLSCIFTFVLLISFGRYTAVTGKTALHSYKMHFGAAPALIVIGSVLFSECVSSMGVMGIVVQVVQEWSRPLTSSGEGISPVLLESFFIGMLYFLFWNGSHRFFEKVLAIFVGFMGLSFVMTMFMVIPEPSVVIRGMIPSIPDEAGASLLIAGMVGTTMGGVLYIVRSILVQEKGWTVRDLALEKRDALISSGGMFLLSLAVMACAAGTLFPLGLHVDNAIDMVKLLEPLAGRFAISIFVAGIVAGGLSSWFPIILLAPWLLADYKGEKADLKSPRNRLIVLAVALLGLVVPIFGGRPVLVTIISQAMVAIATPLIILMMILLLNRENIMGKYQLGRGMNVILAGIFLFSVFIAILGIYGIRDLL